MAETRANKKQGRECESYSCETKKRRPKTCKTGIMGGSIYGGYCSYLSMILPIVSSTTRSDPGLIKIKWSRAKANIYFLHYLPV